MNEKKSGRGKRKFVREIGSEFWDVPTSERANNCFSENIQWFISGRSALQAIIKELKHYHTVAIPSWCCDSIVKPFIDAGINVHFYPVYWQDRLIQEINMDEDILFLMDYFGYTIEQPDLSEYKGVVIRDVTHSFFSTSYTDADYYFGSLRKWCGVWTGGYAWSKDSKKLIVESADDSGYTHLREKAMQLKDNYLNGYSYGNKHGIADKEYLKVFEKAEETLDCVGAGPAADRDVWLAKILDVDGMKHRRRMNAEVLRSALTDWLFYPEMALTDCPMFVPILVPDGRRDELRRFLINKEIYCPVHWPTSNYHKLDDRTRYIYENELSLVCDQRYTEEDMNRLVDTIRLLIRV